MYLCRYDKHPHVNLKRKMMNEELEKIELQIERLKVAIQQAQRKAKILEIDMDAYIDELLELLSEAIKEKENLKKTITSSSEKRI